ncbi:vacuolar protein sorting/targeting protein PEP1, partial [Kappamyces sp. JEL0680]
MDFFKTTKPLVSWTSQCQWAQSINPAMDHLKDRILCTQWPLSEQHGDVAWKDVSRLSLVMSDTFFSEGSKKMVALGGGLPVLGTISDWLVGVVAFSVMESSNSSLVVDVVSARPGSTLPLPFGTLFASNSDGKYFSSVLEHTNRDLATGMVDFELIQSTLYEGVQLANTVKNWQGIMDRVEVVKQLATQMSFDNGRTWSLLQPPLDKTTPCTPKTPLDASCSLHLHSVTTTKNVGKVFSVTSAPGTIIGVGSVGDHLAPYEESDTFLSHDSGKTWSYLQKGPHKFEILNYGAAIVLIPDSYKPSSSLLYSKNNGRDWEKMDISLDKSEWVPLFTTLDAHSTSLQMLLVASRGHSGGETYVVHLDFAPIFDRQCKGDLLPSNSDLELYKLEAGNGKCILGRISSHYRRNTNVDCSMPLKFPLDAVTTTACSCSDLDFECDAGYIPDSASASLSCVPDGPVHDQPLDCKVGSTYQGLSGYRLIPGDICTGGDIDKTKPVPKQCQPGSSKPPNEPTSHSTFFDDHLLEMVQIPQSNTSLVLNRKGHVWRSVNQGETWAKYETPGDAPIVRILGHDTKHSRVFLLTTDSIYVSDDALTGDKSTLVKMNTPEPYNSFGIPIIDFHPTQPDWYTFVGGGRDCSMAKKCNSRAYTTKDGGKNFQLIETWVGKCIWARDVEFEITSLAEDAVFCSSYKFKDGRYGGQDTPQKPSLNPLQLTLLGHAGASSIVLLNENVLDFYVIEDIMMVATGEVTDPVLKTSIDGQSFKRASFPPVSFQRLGFTVLESHSEGVYLDLLQNMVLGSEYGMLFKSSENGESFSKSLSFTNRGSNGKVDFAKLPGIAGIAIANVVTNIGTVGAGSKKIVQSRISFNDGATWGALNAPERDSYNNTLCSDKSCKLHLHLQATDAAYRGMISPFGTKNSAGLMLAVGNAGDSLRPYDSGDVFLTRDGGRSWQEIKKEAHMWAIADSGGL